MSFNVRYIMNILYIHQYFVTPEQSGGTRSYWIAQELLKQGHQVTMITTNVKTQQKEIREEKIIDGIKVVYFKEEYNQSMSVFRRLISYLGFVNKSYKEAAKQKGVDLVIATSTPLTVGITALYMRIIKKVPYVFEVRDLWPEVPIQMGAFKSSWIIKPMRWFEKKIYQKAEHVIALSPGMQDGVMKYLPREKTSMIPNMSKIDKFWSREVNKDWLQELGLEEGVFRVIHFGSLGLANAGHTIIESAKLLKDNHTIQFLFVGGGSEEEKLKQMCIDNNLNNVLFFGKIPMKELSETVNLCDVSIVSFKDLPILYTNSPNKLFDSLSAGKPILVNSAGWTKAMVEENNCGYYVNPNHPQELVEKVKYLQANPEICKTMGRNARKLAETKYDKSLLCKEFATVIEQVMQRAKERTTSNVGITSL